MVQLQPSAHVRLVDEPQHRRVVAVGDQQPQADAAEHLLHRDAPSALLRPQVHQLRDVGQLARVDTHCGADVFAHRDRELRQCRADVLDAAQLLCGVVTGDPRGLLRVLGVGGRLAPAVEFGEQFGGLAGEFVTQIPELVGGIRDVQALRGDQRLVGGASPRHLLGLRLGARHLRLQRPDARARPADLCVERIPFGLGEIELAGDVLVLVAELVDGGVQCIDLRWALGQPDVIGVCPHHRLIHQIDDAQVGGLGRVALLDLLDVAEDLALALRDGQELAGIDEGVDLLERLGQPGQAAWLVEHELADELFQSTNAFQRLGLAEQLLGGIGGADADGRVQLGEVLRLDLGGEPPVVVLEDARVEATGRPPVADVLDVAVAVGQDEPARGVRPGLAGEPLEHQAGDGSAGIAGVGDGDRGPRGAVAAQVHDLAGTCVAALTPGATDVLVDGASARVGACGRVVAGRVEVPAVERQESERNRIEQ